MIGVAWIMTLFSFIQVALPDQLDVCNGENSNIRCDRSQIIIVDKAEFGRMDVGRCITTDNDYMGCTNDVLSVLDVWCSGRSECAVEVPNRDLETLGTNCLDVLIKYLRVEYSCRDVYSICSGSRPTELTTTSGLISSQLTDTKDCGLANSPWVISAKPGQTIGIYIIDFGLDGSSSNLVSCPRTYGYIYERSLGITYTICGGRHRQDSIYSSKTNTVEIQILQRNAREDKHFVIEFAVTGCPELLDLSSSPDTWYKRDGNEAAIGCEHNDQEWRLTCTGNTWVGQVGNCAPTEKVAVKPKLPEKTDIHPAVTMTGIAGGAVVLCVVTMVIGTVYVKKYRLRQETRHFTRIYNDTGAHAQIYYRPMTVDDMEGCDISLPDTFDKTPVALWDISHGETMSYPDQCTCPTLPPRSVNMVIEEERQSCNSVRSTCTS